MKKNAMLAFVGTLVIAAVAFSGISFKATSLNDLRATAQVSGCTPHTGTDCLSSATGNIYSNYEAF